MHRAVLSLFVLLVAAATAQTPVPASLPAPPLPVREFRGAWIATVDNIDWPSKKGLSTAAAQAELAAIVDQAAALKLNALVFQVRPCGDAFYRSDREPWSEWLTGRQGQAPDPAWDPLQFLLERSHAQGLEVHAWFNPFRARHPASKSPEDARHVLRKLGDACVDYGTYRWMDPGDARAADWSLAVIADVVARYDVDGVHLDDYFYPYPQKGAAFADDASWQRYRGGGGTLKRDDWRRANIDGFVQRLHQQTRAQKPAVKVGISPFGIARPGVPAGIQAGIDQYADLYADVVPWLQRGLVDYLAPQLYWPIDQKAQSFPVLLAWWCEQNTRGRHVWPGLSASRALAGKAPWRDDELGQQIERVRTTAKSPGHVLFSWKALRPGSRLRAQLAEGPYAEAAPVPASPWLEAALPPAPRLRVARGPAGVRAEVETAAGVRFYCVQARVAGQWRTVAMRGRATAAVDLPAGTTAVAVRALADNGELSPAATLTVDG